MDKANRSYQTKFKGTTFNVVLASADNAKQTFEELAMKRIREEAARLPPDKIA